MASKILVIISTANKEKAHTGLMYARNAIKYKWVDEVKTVFFGPSEQLIVTDEDLIHDVEELVRIGETVACKYISDNVGSSKAIEKLGVKIEYVGTMISQLIKEGYVPMVW